VLATKRDFRADRLFLTQLEIRDALLRTCLRWLLPRDQCELSLRIFERLIKTALPRIRDFRGVSPKAFDGNGNYTLGVPDQSIFPEVELDKIKRNIGFDVTICTSARTNEEAKSLLAEMGMPFSDRAKKPAAAPAA
jgi:hypothetical protein